MYTWILIRIIKLTIDLLSTYIITDIIVWYDNIYCFLNIFINLANL